MCQGSFETRAAARFAEAFQGQEGQEGLGELLATSFLKAQGVFWDQEWWRFGDVAAVVCFWSYSVLRMSGHVWII